MQSQTFRDSISSTISGTISSVPNSIRALAMMLAISAGTTLPVASALADDTADKAREDGANVEELEGDFDQPIEDNNTRASGNSFTISNTWDQNGKRYNVTNTNGKVDVRVDGEKLPNSQFRNKAGKLEILDDKGNVEASIDTPNIDGNGGIRMRFGQQGHRQGGAGDPFADIRKQLRGLQFPEVPAQPEMPAMPEYPDFKRPPVMLGINMSEVEEGVRVDRVIDDLPASKGGVEVGDIITKVGGQRVNSTPEILEQLQERKDGDKLDIVVLRDGKERSLTLDLVAFKPEALGMEELPEVPLLGDLPITGRLFPRQGLPNAWVGNNDEMRKQLKQLREELLKSAELAQGNKGDAQKALVEAHSALKEAAERLAKLQQEFQEGNANGLWFTGRPGGNGKLFVEPVEQNRLTNRRPRTADTDADQNLKELRDEVRQMREEMKAMREKSQEQTEKKP